MARLVKRVTRYKQECNQQQTVPNAAILASLIEASCKSSNI